MVDIGFWEVGGCGPVWWWVHGSGGGLVSIMSHFHFL